MTVAAAGVNPTLSITGVPQSSSSAQQIAFGLVLSAPYTQTITGQVTLAFQPSSSNPMDDPAIQFSTGGRTASFTIPARATAAIFAASAIAFQTGLRYPQRLAGIMALSTYLPLRASVVNEAAAVNRDIPILMCHGTHDGVVPPGLGEASRDVLVKLGYRIDWRSYPMAHQVCLEEVIDISKWLTERLS